MFLHRGIDRPPPARYKQRMKSYRYLIALAAAAVALSAAGCGRKETKDSPAPAGKGKSDPVSGYVGGVLKSGEHAKGVVGLTALQAALRMYQVQEGGNPASLQDLVTKGYLPEMPPEPVGKRYAYDAASGKVELKDK